MRMKASAIFACVTFAAALGYGQGAEEGIPVTDPLVITKCAKCHASDDHGNMQRVSWLRYSPEGWQDVIKQAIVINGATLNAGEARSVLKYLASSHGLAPEEAQPFLYYPEHRVRDESDLANETLRKACARCHGMARSFTSRRSLDEWTRLEEVHVNRHQADRNAEAIADLAKAAPLHTAEWTRWSAHLPPANLTGRWLVTASVAGRGNYYGEMEVQTAGAAGEFRTRVTLRSAKDGSLIVRSGLAVVYAGYAWRGRSQAVAGSATANLEPDSLESVAREVLSFSPDQTQAEGRWFWGQYQEFGFDVKLQRASLETTLMGIEGAALKTGSQGNRVRVMGDHFLTQVAPAQLKLGGGVVVRSIVSQTETELVAEVAVEADASPGKRDLTLGESALRGAITVYDRVDYIKVIPDTTLASFGDDTGARAQPRGYQQFVAVGYQRGPDGKRHTDDDLELGPVDVNWTLRIFYSVEGSRADFVGSINATGLFTPASTSPKTNFDVWAIATAKTEKDQQNKPLVGKGYLVVTVPFYTFNGRRYVRDQEHWVDDGPAQITADQPK